MICAFLLFSGVFQSAGEVLDFYASKRTFDCKGVTLPSQRRYVSYFAAKLSLGLEYTPVKLLLSSIVLEPPPVLVFSQQAAHIQLQVHQTLEPHFDSGIFTVDLTKKRIILELPKPLLLNGDVKIAFCQKFNMDVLHLGTKPTFTSHVPHSKLCHFWVNTCFLALGQCCALSHTVREGVEGGERERSDSQVMVLTRDKFEEADRGLVGNSRSQGRREGRDGIQVRLDKGQVDKAAKDESGRFGEDFAIKLQLYRWANYIVSSNYVTLVSPRWCE
jgi:hypothetical protein